MSNGSDPGHVTSIMLINFHFLEPKSLHILVEICSMVSEKSKFEFSYVNDIGLRSSYYSDLEYAHTYIYSISCLH